MNAAYPYQLNSSHVLLPPQKLLETWASSRKTVVEIHDDVDTGVHHGMERSHSPLMKTKIISQTPVVKIIFTLVIRSNIIKKIV